MTLKFPTPDPGLDARLRALPTDIAPSRDLWPGIAAGISMPMANTEAAARRPAPRATFAIAAGIAIAALGGLVGWEAARQMRPAATTALAEPVEAPHTAKYLATRELLEASYRQRVTLLAPTTRLRIERDLRTVRQAIADIRAALAADPDSRVLSELLASTSQQELDIYAAVATGTAQLTPGNRT
jgi:hypothetical protein